MPEPARTKRHHDCKTWIETGFAAWALAEGIDPKQIPAMLETVTNYYTGKPKAQQRPAPQGELPLE